MFTEFETLPEFMSAPQVHRYAIALLSSNEPVETILEKLNKLADIQWHTYETTNSILQEAVSDWLLKNWNSSSQFYLEAVLGISYCFGLDKELYIKALPLYLGEHFSEFKKNLDMSEGDSINPWWSMQLKNV
jgi:hypothetical protein